jgi:pimeloyl-ACP methyl ester carboxylesterase
LLAFGLVSGVFAQRTSSSPSPSHVNLEPCSNAKFDQTVRCGKYEVFENRKTRSGRKIQLSLMVLPSFSAKPASDPVFFLAGGPGQSAVAVAIAGGKNLLSDERSQRDIVLVDQRGTGGSIRSIAS